MSGVREVNGRAYQEVSIGLPLPLNVVTALQRLIGKAWPGALVGTSSRSWDHVLGGDVMTMLVPLGEAARSVRARDARVGADDGTDVTRYGADGVALDGPAMHALTRMMLPLVVAAFEETPEAANYLEQIVSDDFGPRYVVIAARSGKQTPHALRTRAEEDARAARAAHDDLLATVRAHLARDIDPARASEVLDDLARATERVRALTPTEGTARV